MLMALSSVGLPGLNNFVSEMLMLAGVVSIDATPASGRGWLLAIGAAVGIVLGAWYTMTLLRNVFFGPLMEPSTTEGTSPASDLTPRELTAVLPLVVLCVVLGVFPQPVLDASRHDVNVVAALSNDARERAGWKPRPIDRSSPMAGLPTMPHLQDQ
jgi:NADH-quinone oxidoreductase subunit M